MSTLNNIEAEIAALPPNLRSEVLDFVQFVKQRHGLSVSPKVVTAASDSGDSPFFQALDAAGLVGCVESNEQLSTTYKSKLDFSTKHGVLP
jgi:hypothetical protein